MQKIPMTQGRILSVREAVRRVQAMAAPYLEGAPSLADELSRDRRAAAVLDD